MDKKTVDKTMDRMQKYFIQAKYSVPKDLDEAMTRLRINLPSHAAEYAPLFLFMVMVMALCVASKAMFLFANIFAVLFIAAAYVLPRQYKLERNLTLACYAGAALVIVVMFALTKVYKPEVWAFVLAFIAAAVHAVFRPVSTMEKFQDKVQDKVDHLN